MNWNELMPYFRQGNKVDNIFIGHVKDHDDIGPTLVGLANVSGGSIVVGMDLRNFHLYGSDVTQEWVDQLISQYCLPSIHCEVSLIQRGDKYVSLLTVKEGENKPFYYKRKCYTINQDTAALEIERELEIEMSVPNVIVQPVQVTQPVMETVEVVATKPVVANVPCAPSFSEKQTIEVSEAMYQPSLEETALEPVTISVVPLRKRVNTENLNKRQKKLLTYLQRRNSIRNKKYRELYGEKNCLLVAK